MIGMFAGMLSAFSQAPSTDSSAYQVRKLRFEEANIVSSYYHQDGNNSAVTGGIGTEKLTDFSNSFQVKLTRYDTHLRKHSFDFDLGIDHYTSASSDKINPNTISSASYSDSRVYPSLNWTMENETKGTTIGAGLSSSTEFDYQSFGANILLAKKSKDKSAEFSFKLQAYLDHLKVIRPIELRPFQEDQTAYARSARNTFVGSLSYSKIINHRLQVALLMDLIYQHGYLGLPFHRVYFLDNSLDVENLPGSRFKLPLALRANYFVGDKIIVRTYYRYYQDDWGLKAHTINLEVPYKITPFLSVSPFYRYYTQEQVDYFAPYQKHKPSEKFFTSNYDLSTFHSNFFGAGFRYAPPENILHINHFSSVELRYGHYAKNIGMTSDIISLDLGIK